jgi:hypothetical protein
MGSRRTSPRLKKIPVALVKLPVIKEKKPAALARVSLPILLA